MSSGRRAIGAGRYRVLKDVIIIKADHCHSASIEGCDRFQGTAKE